MKDELDAAVAAIRARAEGTPAVGVVLASGLARGGAARIPVTPEAPDALDRDPHAYVPRPSVEPLALVRLSTVQLAGVLLRRGLAAIGKRLNVVGRRRR